MLNDFEANGYGVTALEPEHLVVLNDVPPTTKVHARRTPIQICCKWQPLSMSTIRGYAATLAVVTGAMAA